MGLLFAKADDARSVRLWRIALVERVDGDRELFRDVAAAWGQRQEQLAGSAIERDHVTEVNADQIQFFGVVASVPIGSHRRRGFRACPGWP